MDAHLTWWRLSAAVVAMASRAAAQAPPVQLSLPGPSTKVEQINGDCDWTSYDPGSLKSPEGPVGPCLPTASQTIRNAGVMADGLGYSFEHNGLLYLLFGDTIGGVPGSGTGTSPPTTRGPLCGRCDRDQRDNSRRGRAADVVLQEAGRFATVDSAAEPGAAEWPAAAVHFRMPRAACLSPRAETTLPIPESTSEARSTWCTTPTPTARCTPTIRT